MKIEASTFFLQWATGGMLFLWVTTRERLVALGYGWTTRMIYIAIAASSLILGLNLNSLWIREVSTVLFLISASFYILVLFIQTIVLSSVCLGVGQFFNHPSTS